VDLPVSQRAVHDPSLYATEPGSTSEERLKLLAGLAATPDHTAKTGTTETDPQAVPPGPGVSETASGPATCRNTVSNTSSPSRTRARPGRACEVLDGDPAEAGDVM